MEPLRSCWSGFDRLAELAGSSAEAGSWHPRARGTTRLDCHSRRTLYDMRHRLRSQLSLLPTPSLLWASSSTRLPDSTPNGETPRPRRSRDRASPVRFSRPDACHVCSHIRRDGIVERRPRFPKTIFTAAQMREAKTVNPLHAGPSVEAFACGNSGKRRRNGGAGLGHTLGSIFDRHQLGGKLCRLLGAPGRDRRDYPPRSETCKGDPAHARHARQRRGVAE